MKVISQKTTQSYKKMLALMHVCRSSAYTVHADFRIIVCVLMKEGGVMSLSQMALGCLRAGVWNRK